MNMLGHDHIPDHNKAVSHPHLFQNPAKQISPMSGAEQRTTMIATRCDEVQVSASIVTMQTLGHGLMLGRGKVARL